MASSNPSNVRSGAVLGFKVGSQDAVNTMLAAGNRAGAVHGTFYLAEDSHRLYIGNEDTSLSPVNEGVTSVAGVSSLPSITSDDDKKAYAGAFYYAANENILCVFNGQNWVQINRVVDHRIASFTDVAVDVTDGVELQQTIEDDGGQRVTSRFHILGDNGTVITKGTATVNVGGTNVTVPTITVSSKYTLTSEAKTGGVDLQLKSEDGSNDTTVGIIAGNDSTGSSNITVSKDGNDIKLVTRDTKVSSVAITGQPTGFKVSVNDSYGGSVSGTVEPKIKIGETPAAVDFVNGTATLNVYTIGEVDDKFKALNAMTYIGTIGTTGTAATSISTAGSQPVVYKGTTPVEMHVGDTMLVSSTMSLNGVTCYPGSLIIARGTEDADGVITSGLTFDIVEASQDTDTHYRFIENTTGDGISLRSDRGDEMGILSVVAGDDIEVTESATNLVGNSNNYGVKSTITVKHKTVARTDTTGTNISTTKADTANSFVGTKNVDIITKVTTNAQGHVTGVETTQLSINDTNSRITKNTNTTSSYSDSNDKNIGVIKQDIQETFGAGGTQTSTSYSAITSKSLNISSETGIGISSTNASTTAGLNIEMLWGSF